MKKKIHQESVQKRENGFEIVKFQSFSKIFSVSISAQKLKVLRKYIKSELVDFCRFYLIVDINRVETFFGMVSVSPKCDVL